uniref:Autophagy-related protein n=1 Tax=Dendroctonus ponderosae TaxID=77166 RepID=A0AAR5PX99_DENPD
MNDERKFYVREVKMPILNFGGRDIKKEEIMAIKDRFPSKIPVIIHKYQKDHFLPVLDKSKFLIPGDMSMSHFQAILRNRN